MAGRDYSIDIGQYDQVVAVTQEMINKGLQDLYDNSGLGNTTLERIGSRDSYIDNLVLGPPSVIIVYKDDSPWKLRYRIHAKSGTYNSYESNKSTAKLQTFTIKDWYFAFNVDMAMSSLTGADLEDVKNRLEVPADYSITKLAINFKDVNLSSTDIDDSDFGGAKLNNYQLTSLKTWLVSTTDETDDMTLSKYDFQLLGYQGVKGNSAVDNSPQATFVPNGMHFQTYPWKDPNDGSKNVLTGARGNARLNCLLYNETVTGGQDITKIPSEQKYIKYQRNWTPGRADAPDFNTTKPALGRFLLRRSVFVDRFLIPKLATFANALNAKISGTTGGVGMDSSYHWTTTLSMGGDEDMKGLSAWELKELGNDPFSILKKQLLGIPQTAHAWAFTKEYDSGDDDWHWGATIALAGRARASNEMYMYYKPGSEYIHVQGRHAFELYCEVWRGIKNHARSKADNFKRSYTWSFDLGVQSVKDGGLQFVMANSSYIYSKDNSQDDLEYIGGRLAGWIDDNEHMMKSNLDAVEYNLMADLGASGKLILPASGVLYYKNPVYTPECDLVCDIEYKGASENFKNGVNPDAPDAKPYDGDKDFHDPGSHTGAP